MKTSLLSALVLTAACAQGTQLDIHAPVSMAGAALTSNQATAQLDASGHGQILIEPQLHGGDVLLTVQLNGKTENLFAECVLPAQPGPIEDPRPVDGISLQLRRVTSDGSCALIISSMSVGGKSYPGNADPSQFDDFACGSFAAATR